MATQSELDVTRGTAASERRQWGRFVSTLGEILIDREGGSPLHADFLDESFGGIGLLLDKPDHLEVGSAISLHYDGVPMRGMVRSVANASEAKVRVGVEWIAAAPEEIADPAKALVEERLFLLFRLWEAGKWQALRTAAWQLMRDADAHAWHDVVQSADVLRTAVEQDASQATVRQAIEGIVDALTACPA